VFPLLGEAEPGLSAPVFVMLREHAQIWATLDALEREPAPGTALALCRQLTVRLLQVRCPDPDHRLPGQIADRRQRRAGAGLGAAGAAADCQGGGSGFMRSG
jgi:hypothetical protein